MNQDAKSDNGQGKGRGPGKGRSGSRPRRRNRPRGGQNQEARQGGQRQGDQSERRRPRRPHDRHRGQPGGKPSQEAKRDGQQGPAAAGQNVAAQPKRDSRPERQKSTKRRIWLEAVERETSPWFTARAEGGRPLRLTVLFGSKSWDPLVKTPPREISEGAYTRAVQLEQVHGDQIHLVGSAAHADTFPREGDALVTRAPGLALVIATADCIPLMLADRRGTTVAAVHAGWRGIAAGLPGKVVQRMADAFQIQSGRFLAFIGPSISHAGYRVGEEVVQKVSAALPDDSLEAVLHQEEDGPHLDLEAAVRAQLKAAGLHERSIFGGLPSTDDPGGLFHSHRQSGGAAGRMHSMIYLHAAEEEEPVVTTTDTREEPPPPQPEKRRRPPRRAR